MGQTITISPVTRIEGHAKITVKMDDAGNVADARFHVVEFRGFEKFCVGRSFWEMPGITARICGICPVSHSLASSLAGDMILGVKTPRRAKLLRTVMTLGQIVQSHALSFYHLSGPDLFLGMESDPAARNIAGLLAKHPDVAKDGIRLRQIGQSIIRILGGQSVHPAWMVPGGVLEGLTEAKRDAIAAMIPEGIDIATRAVDLLMSVSESFAEEVEHYGNFPSLFLGTVTHEGGLEFADGLLRMVDSHGRVLEKGFTPDKYNDIIDEASQPWSYLKFPYYREAGFEEHEGMYRVGPLARLNVCDFAGTPLADRELRRFRQLGEHGQPVVSSFHYHYARLIEILFGLEKIAEILVDPQVIGKHVRAEAGVNQLYGVGAAEAPRGTLFHEYHVDEHGILTKVNLIIATGQNNLAMNKTVRQIAKKYLSGSKITEGFLNRIEHGIRLFDPCLSCSTHADGGYALDVRLEGPDGALLDSVRRG